MIPAVLSVAVGTVLFFVAFAMTREIDSGSSDATSSGSAALEEGEVLQKWAGIRGNFGLCCFGALQMKSSQQRRRRRDESTIFNVFEVKNEISVETEAASAGAVAQRN